MFLMFLIAALWAAAVAVVVAVFQGVLVVIDAAVTLALYIARKIDKR